MPDTPGARSPLPLTLMSHRDSLADLRVYTNTNTQTVHRPIGSSCLLIALTSNEKGNNRPAKEPDVSGTITDT